MIDSLINSLKAQLTALKNDTKLNKSHYRYATLEVPLKQEIPLSAVEINHSFFISQPDSDLTILGLGSLVHLETRDKNRFHSLKTEFSNIIKLWYRPGETDIFSPFAFLGFAFDENDPMDEQWSCFPNTLLTIPVILIKKQHSNQILHINIELHQSSYDSFFDSIKDYLLTLFKPSKKTSNVVLDTSTDSAIQESWKTLAENAITQIQSGSYEKLVTSRQYSLQTLTPVSISRLIQNLISHYPCCTIFSYFNSGTTIVSASPEKLVTLKHPDIQSNALGGTIVRSKQKKDKTADLASQPASASLPFFLKQACNQTINELSEGEKLLKEHQFISQTIYQNLDPLCHSLKMPVSPFLIKLHNLYHLETLVQGKLMAEYDLFDVINALHPTPAVAGLPTQQAKNWLLENENYHRGWYTGAFGWLDGHNNGDLSVMLRCALIQTDENSQQTKLDLFAGAGIVAGSIAEAEWQETELKMRTILEML